VTPAAARSTRRQLQHLQWGGTGCHVSRLALIAPACCGSWHCKMRLFQNLLSNSSLP